MSRTSSRNVPLQPVATNSEDQAAAMVASIAGVDGAPPLALGDGGGSVPMSRTPSASTARPPPTQSSQYFPTTPTLHTLDLFPLQQPGEDQLASSPNLTELSPTPLQRSPSPSNSSSSPSSRSSDVSSPVDHDGLRQQRRPGFRKFGTASRTASLREPKDETDEEESPAFLPWTEAAGDGANSTPAEATADVQDVQAAVPQAASNPPTSRNRRPRANVGGYEPDRRENTSGGTIKRGLGIQQVGVQPYHAVSDSGTSTPGSQSSPRRRFPDGRRGAESSPSMGSSFSDLSGEHNPSSSSCNFSPYLSLFLHLYPVRDSCTTAENTHSYHLLLHILVSLCCVFCTFQADPPLREIPRCRQIRKDFY
ncbi:hypothetical protein TWF696_005277 [Orbilia brochopaga]|uniref:Uncharacterized protein n=1 Tax=Orbilia brochopaga TaxID=3140254 RepID=A0AAV9V2L4_9PEZI